MLNGLTGHPFNMTMSQIWLPKTSSEMLLCSPPPDIHLRAALQSNKNVYNHCAKNARISARICAVSKWPTSQRFRRHASDAFRSAYTCFNS